MQDAQITLEISRSRFVAQLMRVETIEQARVQIATIRNNFPDATHHVYAFRVGCEKSITEGMSDDGEPSGTAGTPALVVLRGSNLAEVLVVINRYFGGTKLGTGGLVRAYTQAAQLVVTQAGVQEKLTYSRVAISIRYALYNVVTHTLTKFNHTVVEETFADEITIVLDILADQQIEMKRTLQELSSGQIRFISK
jgi:uncharacterized YigZ family protein